MPSIDVKTLMYRTGLTYRQVDYWCRRDIIRPLGEVNPGSGTSRIFDEADVEKIKTMVVVNKTMKPGSLELMKQIYNNYEDGSLYLGPGVMLKWRTPEDHNYKGGQ